MRTCTLSACVFSAAALLAAAGLPAGAQQQPVVTLPPARPVGAPPVNVATTQPTPTPAWASKLITVKFEGGPLKDYMGMIKASVVPATMNVTYSNEAAEANLPPIDLTNISVQSAIEMLSHVTDPNSGTTFRASLVVSGKTTDESPIYLVAAANQPQRGAIEMTQVLSLSSILDETREPKIDARTALQAIETAVDVATRDGEAPAVIKFHEATGTLIVAGTRDQCNTASQVIGTMSQARQGGMLPGFGRTGEVAETNTVALSHADATQLAEAINSVFRGRPGEKTEVAATASPQTNSVIVKAPKRLMVGADAIVALLDRAEPLAAVREARERVRLLEAEMKDAARMVDSARTEAQEQSKLLRQRLAEAEKEGSILRDSAERSVVRLIEIEKQLEQARKTAAETADRLQLANEQKSDFNRQLLAVQAELAKLKK